MRLAGLVVSHWLFLIEVFKERVDPCVFSLTNIWSFVDIARLR
jgi:hypothetical protein